MFNKKFFWSLIFIFLFSGCTFGIPGQKKDSPPPEAGMWRSSDQGKTWQHIKNVPTISGNPGSIASASIVHVEVDPQDNKAIYLGTQKSGIVYTYDGGDTWNQFPQMKSGLVRSIAIDPELKCSIYATFANKIVKSRDCGRTWDDIYFDTRKINMTAIEVDYYNTNVVYAATSQGEIFKSFDKGVSWSTPFSNTKAEIAEFYLDPFDSRLIYITGKNGLIKSKDSGLSWENMNSYLKEVGSGKGIRDFKFGKEQNTIFLATSYGILKSVDGGLTWESIPLLTAPNKADIKTFVVDPVDENIINYVTRNTYYKTTNAGKDWKPKKMFSRSVPAFFFTDAENSSVLYMAFTVN